MKFKWILALFLVFIILGCENNKAQEVKEIEGENKNASVKIDEELGKPDNFRSSYSYVIGHDFGSRMRMDSLSPDLEYLIYGLKQGLLGDSLQFSRMEKDSIMHIFQDTIMAIQEKARKIAEAEMKKIAEENAKKNPEYLKKNLEKPGWKQTASGLQYKVIREGEGKTPDLNDVVELHFKGTLIDGTEFDNTYKRGQTVTFVPQNLIPGWREAILMMKPGARYKIAIPPELAYKEEPAGDIPPNSILLFDIEYLNNLGPFEQNRNTPMMQEGKPMPPKN